MGVFTMMALGTHTAPQAATPATTTRSMPTTKARSLRAGIALIALCAALGSCGTVVDYNDFDTAGNISKQEYEGLLSRRAPAKQDAARGEEPPIPSFQSVLAAPSAPELADIRRVSIAVTETTPVRDVLIELTRRAQVDLEMDPRISGGIIMTATDRPFIDVIARIADLAELRYKFQRNTLRVEIDDPYLEQYRMDVLNVTRSATSSASSSTDASGGGAVGGSGGGNNKSASSIDTNTSSNFWNTIGENIDQVLNGIQSRRVTQPANISAAFVPEAEKAPVPPAPPAAGVPAAPAPAGGAGAAGPLAQAQALADGRQQQMAAAAGQAPQDAPQLKAGQQSGATGSVASSQYSLNPQAGIITVFATQRQHKAVERYLRDVHSAVTQQVLIEAKVLEVTLSDQYRAGVNWTAVFGPGDPTKQLNVVSNFSRDVVTPEFSPPTIAADWSNGSDLSIAVQMVKQFGTVRTLSSPRLTVLNNQMAQLKVASNQVFFELDVTTSDGTTTQAAKTTVESNIKTVPVGLIMSVQPAVDGSTKRISLSLRPSITRISGFINDPGVAVTIAVAQANNPGSSIPNVTSPIPIIETREMDSLLTMESGQTVVMGGLMQETVQTTREGLPGVMDIPLVGQALSENIKQNKVTELVVFIRATLANAAGTVADEDIRLYKTFTPDPRPIAF